MTIQELASQYADQFEQRERNNGNKFYCLKDGAEEQYPELHELIQTAHGDLLPDDWRYEAILDSLHEIADSDDPEDIELEPDIYTHDLMAWLSSHTSRIDYCDEAVNELGAPSQFSLVTVIQMGQTAEKQEVYQSVLNSLQDLIDEMEDEDDDTEESEEDSDE